MKRIGILLTFLCFFVLASYGQKLEKLPNSEKSRLEQMADSIVDVRMNYYIAQFGTPEALEAFYDRSIESIKLEFTPLILDSLMRLEGRE